ncbi:MAG: metalloregulator ArsR/SmtB family transcription factor [Myxococcaceae bacterium]
MSKPPDDVLRALADPTRRAIYESLLETEHPVTHLTRKMRVSQPAVSQHLAVLKDAGLVTPRQEGRHRFYRANPAGLTPLVDWLEHYRRFWNTRLPKLKATLEDLE